MPRYFIEVAYKGTNYAGFQKQDNANSIQAEIERALSVYYRHPFSLTGSSRTDAGVHAKQNFFHFDSEHVRDVSIEEKPIYHLNAILPIDIVVKSLRKVSDEAHSRFDAVARTYEYRLYHEKNPFLQETAYYYPYKLNMELLQLLASEFMNHTNFESFAKRNTQVHSFNCTIFQSEWVLQNDCIVYRVKANRFLRGMVKGLVGTMLRTASKGQSLSQLISVIESKNPTKVDFAVPSHGLTLLQVSY